MTNALTRRRFAKGLGAAGLLAGTAPFNIARSQGGPLKIGVVLPLSGVQAGVGQSCKRGVDIAPALLKATGYTQPIEIVTVDSETNVDVARARAERLIADGCHMLSGPFDSGAAAAIAQVAEQKGVPFVINIAAAPQITEQGYKFVFRNFQTAPQIISRGLALFPQIFASSGTTPKTAVLMHVNDTFGLANKGAIDRIFPTMNLPFKIVESIAYDPAAKDLSVEVAKAKATRADILMTVTRLNDAIILVREMIKQRWEPMGIISPGAPGMYEQQFLDTMGKYSEFIITTLPWANPKAEITRQLAAEFKRITPKDKLPGHIFNIGFTFEALMICADAHKRAASTRGAALAEALRATRIDKRVMIGGPIEFDAKGQCNTIASAALQNRNGVPTIVLPADVAEDKPVFPMPGWTKRG
ncbi:MAG: ABC transporter substrate-binding protein [Pseudorhodoplanes sp.]|nr:ABC transporter substrate-binding protein [Pseudorhodoplanes sp.]